MSKFKVLLLDGIDPAGIDVIKRSKEIEPLVYDKISRDELLRLAGDVEGIIVRSGTSVDRDLISKAGRLKVVGRAGVGVDNVDIDAATEAGILVMNSPGGSTTTSTVRPVGSFEARTRPSKGPTVTELPLGSPNSPWRVRARNFTSGRGRGSTAPPAFVEGRDAGRASCAKSASIFAPFFPASTSTSTKRTESVSKEPPSSAPQRG